MKKLKNLAVVGLLTLSLTGFAGGEKTCEERIKNKDILTTDQISMRVTHCENLKPKREAFRATLTDEQKAIRKNSSLSKRERKVMLAATLTSEQKAMKSEIKSIAKSQREEFRATLTDEQRKLLKERRRERRTAE